MSHVVSISSSENTRPVFMEFTIKLMFHQGLWYEDPDPDLNQDLNYYTPWLARFVVSHPKLRASLRVLRAYYTWILLAQTAVVFTSHSVFIYTNWADKEKIMFSCVNTVADTSRILIIMLSFRTKRRLKPFMENLSKFTADLIRDEKDKKRVDRNQFMCNRVSKCVTLVVVVSYSAIMLYVAFVELIPNRELDDEMALPYDVASFPAFEFSLFFMLMNTILITCGSVCVIPIIICLLIQLYVLWNIFNANLRNLGFQTKQKDQYKERIKSNVNNSRRLLSSFTTDPIALAIREIEYDRDDVLWSAYQGQGHGGSAQLQGDSQETAEESVENERHVSTPGIDSDDDEETLGSFSPYVDQEMQAQLAKKVQQHSELISITHSLVKIFNEFLSASMILYATTLGALLWMSINFNETHLTIYVMFVVIVSVGYLLVCYLGDNITSESAAVVQALYDCDWLRASQSFKRKMLVMMIVANVPVEIKPTGLDPLSLKLYREVNNGAYEVLATIKSFAK